MLFVGLGNPGKEYELTRHNAGFVILDEIGKKFSCNWKEGKKFNAQIGDIIIENRKISLIKPLTYMNLSGISVQKFCHYYNINLDDIIVFHDDIDLNLGRVKFKLGGGNAGHNGLKSLDENIGKNYHRVRIGVGKPQNSTPVSSYVTGKFSNQELLKLDYVVSDILEKLNFVIDKNHSKLSINIIE